MKKSRSFKLADSEILRTTRRGKSTSDKLHTDIAAFAAATTPKKPSPIKTSARLPHYMNSTNSSNARKDRSQVNSHSTNNKNTLYNKSLSSRDSNYRGLAKILTKKISSLKPVKTLIKISSTKSMRSLTKKSPEIALNQNQNVGRATCSSTLRDSKFPVCVMRHPEGTEPEGASAMKVCPYAYCSLNGHHHAPLPPLNSFLASRRRLLRSQKSMRLKDLSSVKNKPYRNRNKEIHTGKIDIPGDPTVLEVDSAVTHLMEEVGTDFFVEIYTHLRKASNQPNGKHTYDKNDEPETNLTAASQVCYDTPYSVKDGAVIGPENGGSITDTESLPDESPDFEISSEYPFNQTNDGTHEESEMDESIISELSDMDWEKSPSANMQPDDESNMKTVCLEGFMDSVLHNEFELDYNFSNNSEDIQENEEGLQSLYEEYLCGNFDAGYGDSNTDGLNKALEIDISSEIRNVVKEDPNIEAVTGHELQEAEDDGHQIKSQTSELLVDTNTDVGDKVEDNAGEDTTETCLIANTLADCEEEKPIMDALCDSDKQPFKNLINLKRPIKIKKKIEDWEKLRAFNPREPRYLTVEPDPEKETVDLRQQMVDERKSAEEWMIDYTLRQAVTKLAPVRKRRVALLVEAFETITPVSKYESHLQHKTTGFAQACN